MHNLFIEHVASITALIPDEVVKARVNQLHCSFDDEAQCVMQFLFKERDQLRRHRSTCRNYGFLHLICCRILRLNLIDVLSVELHGVEG